jgi:hypothetical protein
MVVAAHLKQVDRLVLLLDQEVQLRVRDRPHIIPHGDDALGYLATQTGGRHASP